MQALSSTGNGRAARPRQRLRRTRAPAGPGRLGPLEFIDKVALTERDGARLGYSTDSYQFAQITIIPMDLRKKNYSLAS